MNQRQPERPVQSFRCKKDYQVKGRVRFEKGEIYAGVILGRGARFTDHDGQSIYFLTSRQQRAYFEKIGA